MNFRVIGIILITLLAVFLAALIRNYAKKFQKTDESKKSELGKRLEKRKKEEDEAKQALKEDPMNLMGEKVLLRPVVILDKKPLSVILNDKRVVGPMGMERITRVSQMERIMRTEYMDTIGIYTVVALSSMNVIGLAKCLDDGEEADLLLCISRQYWRHGLGREAAKLLIEDARQKDCTRVRTKPAAIDERNRGFLENLGFTSDGESFIYAIE